MSMMRAQFQRSLFPGLKILAMNEHKEREAQFNQLFRVNDSDQAFEEGRTTAGLGLYGRKQEGLATILDQFKDGFPKRWDHEMWSLGIGMTRRFMRDIKNPMLVSERASDLGRSARQSQEQAVSSILNLAFDGTNAPIPDGKALCATDHPNVKGGTQSNIISPVSTINVVGIRLMLTKARRFYDRTGVRKIQLDLKWCVVPAEEEWNAREVLESTDRPDTANRAKNVTYNKLTPFVYDFLDADVNNWFGLTDKQQHQIYVWMRERFDVREFEDEKTQVQYMEGAYDMSYGPLDWIGVIGSNPT